MSNKSEKKVLKKHKIFNNLGPKWKHNNQNFNELQFKETPRKKVFNLKKKCICLHKISKTNNQIKN